MDLLCDALYNQFLGGLESILQENNVLPETVVEFILSFHQSRLALKSVIAQLDVSYIVFFAFD